MDSSGFGGSGFVSKTLDRNRKIEIVERQKGK